MGTKILGVIAFAAIAIAADWNYQQNKQEVELSDLALENIDALARGEHVNPAKRKATPIKNEKRFSEQKRKAMKIIKAILEIVSPLLLH